MADIYGRYACGKAQQQGDLSKYVTLDQLRSEIEDLLILQVWIKMKWLFFRINKDD